MASEVFEIGLFKPDAAGNEAVMLPRVWDADTLLRSVAWLRHQNRDGRNIYIRPRGEHNLSLVDDLSRDAVVAMKQAGFAPAAIIETSLVIFRRGSSILSNSVKSWGRPRPGNWLNGLKAISAPLIGGTLVASRDSRTGKKSTAIPGPACIRL